jgi:hypothetical protein
MSPGTGRGPPLAYCRSQQTPATVSRLTVHASLRSIMARTPWAHPQIEPGAHAAESAAQQVAPARRSAQDSNPTAGPSRGSVRPADGSCGWARTAAPAGGGAQGKATIRRPDRAGGMSGHPGPATALSAGQRRPKNRQFRYGS